MNSPVWVGIDLGTQSVRVLAVDGEGNVLHSASAPLASTRDGVRHTQSPEQWWEAVCYCCRQALAAVDSSAVQALSIDATSGTVLLVDDQLNPVSDALMYDDGRAGGESDEANTKGAEFWERMGYRTQRSWALPKLLWLARNEPEALQRGRAMHQNDYVQARLAGAPTATDWSHALKTGYDLVEDRWPVELIEALGFPADKLPQVVAPGTVVGVVSAEAAKQTGLPEGCAIVAGMTDGCASQIAAGAVRPGQWNSVLGTTLVLKGASPERIKDPLGVVYCHRSPSGVWLPGGASSVGAGILTKLFPGADLEALTDAAMALGQADAVMYPLAGKGERFPFVAPEAEAFTLGSVEGEAEAFRAALVGVACIERLCFDYAQMIGAPVHGTRSITGGGVKSAFWNQIRADVLGVPLHVPSSTEAAFGAAVLAASHAAPLEDAVDAMVRTSQVIEPQPRRRPGLMALYVDLLEALRGEGWLPAEVAAYARGKVDA